MLKGLLVFFFTVGLSQVAFAHPIHSETGWVQGFFHPIHGMDHLLTALAIGIWATHGSRRQCWSVPVSFLLGMLCGFLIENSGVIVSNVESAIILSMTGLCLVLMVLPSISLLQTFFISFSCGLPHGVAHALESYSNHSEKMYLLGIILGTAFLHFLAIATMGAISKIANIKSDLILRASGVLMLALILANAGFKHP